MSPPLELVRALAALAEAPAPEHQRLCRLLELPDAPDPARHIEVFSHEVYPFASVYLGPEGMLGGEAKGRIAGFWTAVGVEPPEDSDHVSNLLSLWASLGSDAESEQDEAHSRMARQAADALFVEHLSPWLFVFLDALRGTEEQLGRAGGFHHAWAQTTSAVAREIAPAGDGLPVHLREAPPLPEPSEVGGEGFLDAILSPVRSGMVLARSDFRRMIRDLDLGGRIAERKYALRSYVSQRPGAVFDWLAEEARGWTDRHRNPNPDIEAFWVDRAARASDVLDAAAAEARRWVES